MKNVIDEVKYFGDAVVAGNKIINAVMRLLSRENSDQISIPYTYFLNFAQISGLSSTDVSWPVNVRVISESKNDYADVHNITKITDLISFANKTESEHPDATYLVSLPIQLNTASNYIIDAVAKNITFFLAKDYILMYNTKNNKSFILNGDMKNYVYTSNQVDLDDEFVYQLVYSHNHWIIDNIFEYEDARLKNITSKTLSTLTKEEIEEFREGYIKGMQSQVNYGYLIPMGNNPVYVSSPSELGMYLGSNVRAYLSSDLQLTGLNFGPNDIEEILNFAVNSNQKLLTRVSAAAQLHNELIKGQMNLETIEDNFKKVINGYVNPGYATWSYLSGTIFNIANRVNQDSVNILHYPDVPVIIGGFEGELKIKKEQSTSYENIQFRFISPPESKWINIRIQIGKIQSHYTVSVGDNPPMSVNSNGKGKSDIYEIGQFKISSDDIPPDYDSFKKYKEAMQALSFNKKSQAGTDQLYAAVEIREDFLVSSETGQPVISKQKFIELMENSGYI